MRTEKNVYKFNELGKEAKDKALSGCRDINTDFEWWENTLDELAEKCKKQGVNFDTSDLTFDIMSRKSHLGIESSKLNFDFGNCDVAVDLPNKFVRIRII